MQKLACFAAATAVFVPAAAAVAETPISYCACGQSGSHTHAAASSGEDAVAPAPFRTAGRWTNTATNGTTGIGNQGDPVTLRWGIVPDGTAIPGETAEPSSLRAFMDSQFGAGTGPAGDLTQRPWFQLFSSSFNRWSQIAGLSYAYEAADDGSTLYHKDANGNLFAGAAGQIGVRGDVRIGGHYIDGQSGSNTLAYNFYPTVGEMVIDTSNTSFFAPASNNSRGTRNVIMHEHGHGIGLNHLESNNSNHLMEPFISTAFDGPQFDDILGAQRQYGDALEKNGGNNTAATATQLGAMTPGVTRSRGTHADDAAVLSSETDFISIDDETDRDFFSFAVGADTAVSLTLSPKGPTYDEGAQGGTQTPLNTMALNDLTLQLLSSDGLTQLAFANATGLGGAESILNFELPGTGTYFARIAGLTSNNIQMYRLDVTTALVPEPSVIALAGFAFAGLALRRRRA